MTKMYPCLCFDNQAEEAASFYTSIFPNSRIGQVNRYGKNMHAPEGSVMVAFVNLNGHEFMLLNAGAQFKFTETTSFVINCKDQAEVDYYWNALTADGGQESMCGWLKDKFGVSWQIVPDALPRLLASGKPAVMQAVMKMKKLDIAVMEAAANS